MPQITDKIAELILEYSAARRAATEGWSRGIRGQEWLTLLFAEKKALADLANAVFDWSDRQARTSGATIGGQS